MIRFKVTGLMLASGQIWFLEKTDDTVKQCSKLKDSVSVEIFYNGYVSINGNGYTGVK